MTKREFCYWLHGYFEMFAADHGDDSPWPRISIAQARVILRRAKMASNGLEENVLLNRAFSKIEDLAEILTETDWQIPARDNYSRRIYNEMKSLIA